MALERETKESLRRRLEESEGVLQDITDLLADAGFVPEEGDEEGPADDDVDERE